MTIQTVEALVKHWVTFVEGHVKLLLILGSAALLFHFGEKGLAAWEAHDKRNQSLTDKQIELQTNNNKTLADELTALKLEFVTKTAQDEAKIASLQNSLNKQQKIDQELPLPDLGKRWEALLALSPGNITPQTDGKLAVSSNAAHSTVNELEKVPVLSGQLNATQDELKSCKDVVSKQTQTISGLNVSVALEQKGRVEDAKVAADKQRSAWVRGFKWGAVAGFVGGLFALHKI